MPRRRVSLATGEVYHIFSKSIAHFKIFNNHYDFGRMFDTINYYKTNKSSIKFSKYLKLSQEMKIHLSNLDKKEEVQIIAYCFMPTHVHFILKQVSDDGITNLMRKVLNSYSHYFNTKIKRRGPLWQNRFRNRLVKSDEQLLHLTRYLHLNPVTTGLMNKPEEWRYSSYKEYIKKVKQKNCICEYENVLDIVPDSYSKFVNDRISYQKELAKIKNLILE